MSEEVKKALADLIERNKASFEKIDAKDDELIRAITFRIEQRDGNYVIKEEINALLGSRLVSSWRCLDQFKPIPNLFQDTPTHQVKDYEDMRAYHDGLVKVIAAAEKFVGEVFLSYFFAHSFSFIFYYTSLKE